MSNCNVVTSKSQVVTTVVNEVPRWCRIPKGEAGTSKMLVLLFGMKYHYCLYAVVVVLWEPQAVQMKVSTRSQLCNLKYQSLQAGARRHKPWQKYFSDGLVFCARTILQISNLNDSNDNTHARTSDIDKRRASDRTAKKIEESSSSSPGGTIGGVFEVDVREDNIARLNCFSGCASSAPSFAAPDVGQFNSNWRMNVI